MRIAAPLFALAAAQAMLFPRNVELKWWSGASVSAACIQFRSAPNLAVVLRTTSNTTHALNVRPDGRRSLNGTRGLAFPQTQYPSMAWYDYRVEWSTSRLNVFAAGARYQWLRNFTRLRSWTFVGENRITNVNICWPPSPRPGNATGAVP